MEVKEVVHVMKLWQIDSYLNASESISCIWVHFGTCVTWQASNGCKVWECTGKWKKRELHLISAWGISYYGGILVGIPENIKKIFQNETEEISWF